MESNALRLKTTVKFKNFINQFLENTERDCDEEWWNKPQAAEALTQLAGPTPWAVSDSIELQIEDTGNLVVAVWGGGMDTRELDRLTEEIRNRFEKIVETRKPAFEQRRAEAAGKHKVFLKKLEINFLFFTKDFRSRVALEKKYIQEIRDSVIRTASKKFAVPITTSRCTFIVYQEYHGETARIRGINRHDSLQMPPISGRCNTDTQKNSMEELIRSSVVTVQLRQLVNLYNQVGDLLFRNNVRFGISEAFDISKAMRKTLEDEPELFWFKNNGITLLVEDPDFRLDCPGELQLGSLEAGSQPRFSVVNGAQTITIAAKYAFEQEYLKQHDPDQKDLYEKRLENFDKARVMLRVIHVPVQSELEETDAERAAIKTAMDLANDISVSLNRQKPIRQEDIAFSTPFVQKLTEYLSEAKNGAPFYLTRRGEEISYAAQLNLVEFSRARLACSNYPGKARTASSTEIMKIELGTDALQNRDIFVNEWMESEADEKAVFQRYYGAVWFADRISKMYVEKAGKFFRSENWNAQAAVQNGKWYFTALVVQLLNGFETDADNRPDFSAFDWSAQAFAERLPKAIDVFSQMAVYIAGETCRLDSNDFKNEKYYQQMLAELRAESKAAPFKEFSELFFPADKDKSAKGPNPRQNIVSITLGHDSGPTPVKTGKEAFAKTIAYILREFSPDPAKLVQYDSWLTDNPQKAAAKKGNFNSSSPVVLYCGKKYWIGSESLNNDRKFSCVRSLCESAQVPRGEISWFTDKEERYKW